jgi:hypothetical protein
MTSGDFLPIVHILILMFGQVWSVCCRLRVANCCTRHS